MTREQRERRPRSGTSQVAPRASRRRWRRAVQTTKRRWRWILAFDPFWIVLFLLVGTWALTPRTGGWWRSQPAEVAAIATRDYVAPDDALVPDEDTTEEKRQRAREGILPVYDFDTASADRLGAAIVELFERGRSLTAPPEGAETESTQPPETGRSPEDMFGQLVEGTTLNLAAAQAALLYEREFSPEVEEHLIGLLRQILDRGIVAGKAALLENLTRGVQLRDLQTGQEGRQLDLYDYLDFPEDVQELVGAEVRRWGGFSRAERTELANLLLSNMGPNLYFNQSETLRRQEAAAAAVERVYNRVIAGQVIVRKGDQIDARAADLIARLSGDRGMRAWLLPTLGIFLFLSSLVLVLWMVVRRDRLASVRPALLGEILLLVTVAIVGTRLGHLFAMGLSSAVATPPFSSPQAYFFAVPFASLGLVTVLLYGRSLAIITVLAYSMLAGLSVEESSWTWIVYCMAGSVAAILAVDEFQFRQRSVLMRAGTVVSVVSAAAVLMLNAIGGDLEVEGARLGLEVMCALSSGVLTAAVASFVIPVLESLLSLTTAIKLVELANTNLPLLRRLAFEAPGSFQHSLMVANLAKAGCDAIEADSVLAYTGALYHDIGKILRPEYFVENQRPGQNPHDKLQPTMSALIIINHVKEGLEMAQDYHLPQPISDAIAQHHGTRLIGYFFSRAKETHDPDSGDLSEEKYRYPGPKPQDKVMGVLMLADAVEAASRTLEDPSAARIRNLVKKIIGDCLDQKQLDETDLTLGDIRQVEESFQLVLSHIHHHRLDYPGFEFNAPRGERARREPRVVEVGVGASETGPEKASVS